MFIAAHDWNLEFDVTFEGRNHSAHLVKPSAMPRNIRVQMPRNPSLLDRTGSSFCMSFFFLLQCTLDKSISNMQLTG